MKMCEPQPIETLPDEIPEGHAILVYSPCDGYYELWGEIDEDIFTHWICVPKPSREPTVEHVCGRQGYDPMQDPPCPACQSSSPIQQRENSNAGD